MSTQKKQSKSMNKIHRRKNDQIQKQFICTQGCGKAYGSYAALYTHIRKKHGDAKLPQMKQDSSKARTGKKGRPIAKQAISQNSSQKQNLIQCRLCLQPQCVCIQPYDEQQKNKSIDIMSNEDFILLINQIGNLSIQDKFTWVRNTEEDYQFMEIQGLKNLQGQFNQHWRTQLKLNNKIEEFLSFSSRYWDPKYLKELYFSLFVMKIKKGKKQVLDMFEKDPQFFHNMIECSNIKKEEFQNLCNLMKMI